MAPDQAPEVSAVVVSYNTRELLRDCLRAIEADGGASLELVVVDNASEDGSADVVAAEFPAATLVRSPENLGFARGVNAGARASHGRYLLLVNPDAELHSGSIDALVACSRRWNDSAIVGGRAYAPDGSLDRRSCWGLPSLWSLVCFATGLSTAGRGTAALDPESLGSWRRDAERAVGAVSGALLLVDRRCWDRLGGFDEDYFMYSEDIDLAARGAELGIYSVLAPEAAVTHRAGASSGSSGGKMVLVMAGKVTYLRKRWSPGRRRVGIALLVVGSGLRALLARVLRRSDATWPTVWAERRRWRCGYPLVEPARAAP